MNFFGRKNLTEREELLYIPVLHWMFVAKHVIRSFLIFFGALGALFTFSALRIFGLNNSSFSGYILYITFIWFVCLLFELLIHIFCYKYIKYGVTNKRLMIKRGVFKTAITEIPIDKIESINSHQSLSGSLFNYGNITVNGMGGKSMVFYMVCKPFALRRKINEIIEKEKLIIVFRGNIPKPKLEPEPARTTCKIVDEESLWGRPVKML